MTTTPRAVLITIVVVMTVLLSACGGSALSDTGQSGDLPPAGDLPDLEFGHGEMPITVPDNWPMPTKYAIGATMIDGTRVLTEVTYTAGGDVAELVTFYVSALPEADYDVVSTSPVSDHESDITFAGMGIEGDLIIKQIAPGVSGATLRFTYSS